MFKEKAWKFGRNETTLLFGKLQIQKSSTLSVHRIGRKLSVLARAYMHAFLKLDDDVVLFLDADCMFAQVRVDILVKKST